MYLILSFAIGLIFILIAFIEFKEGKLWLPKKLRYSPGWFKKAKIKYRLVRSKEIQDLLHLILYMHNLAPLYFDSLHSIDRSKEYKMKIKIENNSIFLLREVTEDIIAQLNSVSTSWEVFEINKIFRNNKNIMKMYRFLNIVVSNMNKRLDKYKNL